MDNNVIINFKMAKMQNKIKKATIPSNPANNNTQVNYAPTLPGL